MGTFAYEPLNLERRTIRLIRLLQGQSDDIRCEIFHADFDDRDSAISYEALSYTWGDTTKTETIQLHGQLFHITHSLHINLHYLRYSSLDRILWIDAMSIDQNNDKEKGQQVRQMGDVYRNADRVIFWLGTGTYETNTLMDSLKELEKKSLKHRCTDWSSEDKRWRSLWQAAHPVQMATKAQEYIRGLRTLLDRSWFRRVWIIQEVVNAKAAIVCCGTRCVSARIFVLAPHLTGVEPDKHCQGLFDSMPNPSKRMSLKTQHRDLYALIRRFDGSKASDERDLIFALVGLCSHDDAMGRFEVDYSKTLHEVMISLLTHLFPFNLSYTEELAQSCRIDELAQKLDYFTETAIMLLDGSSYEKRAHNPPSALNHGLSKNDWLRILLQRKIITPTAIHEIIRTAERHTVELLIQERQDEIEVTKNLLEAAAQNKASGVLSALIELRDSRQELIRKRRMGPNKASQQNASLT